MNDEHATADDAPVDDRDGDRGCRGERVTDESPPASTEEFGISDEDMEQIRLFLAKQRHSRSVDDLRP